MLKAAQENTRITQRNKDKDDQRSLAGNCTVSERAAEPHLASAAPGTKLSVCDSSSRANSSQKRRQKKAFFSFLFFKELQKLKECIYHQHTRAPQHVKGDFPQEKTADGSVDLHQWFSARGGFAPPDIWQYLETFWLSHLEAVERSVEGY